MNARRLAVHGLARAHDLGAVGGADALVSQANAEDRGVRTEVANHVGRDARIGGRARPGRYDDALRPQLGDLVEGHRVVSTNERLAAQLSHVPREVVDERIVVVDEENHGDAESGLVRSPMRGLDGCSQGIDQRARLVECFAVLRSGSESATMPPPALKYTASSRT